jgi:predicted ATPase
MGENLAALVSALPRLSSVFEAEIEVDAVPEAYGENRTLEALMRFFEAVGKLCGPTVIVLDDCQWAEEVTFRLLRRWMVQPSGTRHASPPSSWRSERKR